MRISPHIQKLAFSIISTPAVSWPHPRFRDTRLAILTELAAKGRVPQTAGRFNKRTGALHGIAILLSQEFSQGFARIWQAIHLEKIRINLPQRLMVHQRCQRKTCIYEKVLRTKKR